MADYSLIVFDLVSGVASGEVPLRAVKWTLGRNGADTWSADMAINQPAAIISAIGTIVPGDLGKIGGAVVRDGVILLGGPAWTWSADLGAGTLTLAGNGWHSYIRRRTLRTDLEVSGIDQATIAADLVNETQTTGQAPVIDTSDVGTTGVDRDRTYLGSDRSSIGQLVEELAAVEGGFDFRYQTVRVGDLIQGRFLVQYPNTGRRTDLVFEVGKSVTKASATGDATNLATHVDGIGSGTGTASIRTTQANASLIGVYPLLDAQVSHTDVTEVATLASYARQRLIQGQTPVILPRFTVDPNAEPVLGSYVAGDQVLTSGSYGLVDLGGRFRVEQIDGQVATSGETVDVTFSPLAAFMDL